MFFENRAQSITHKIIAMAIIGIIVVTNFTVVLAAAVSMAQEETTEVGELDPITYDAIRLNQTIDGSLNDNLYWLKEGALELYNDDSLKAKEEVEDTTIAKEEEVVDEKSIGTYTVQAGDSLWKIASKVYGDGSLYNSLIELNGLENEYSNIYAGQTLQYYELEMTASAVSVQYSSLHKDDHKPEAKTTSNTNHSTKANAKSSYKARNGVIPTNMTYAGKFKITAYDPYCTHCCGKANGITASGTTAIVGRTIATSSNYPFGTKLYIEGYGTYVVEDRGGAIKGNKIDMVAGSHEECYTLTASNVDVYIVNE